jgi:glyoxylase-like metal-dependent hydrolase (beta-lactamase superfamily II)
MQHGVRTLLTGYGSLIEMSSSVSLLLADQARVLFDTGARTEKNRLIKALETLGLKPEDIDIVANTHLHMDHCENNALFRRAAFFYSDEEYATMLDLAIALNSRRVDLQSLAGQYLALPHGMPRTLFQKVEQFLIKDAVPEHIAVAKRVSETALASLGIKVLATPGHTDGHVSFLVHDAAAGMDVVIAGDVIISGEEFLPNRPTLFTKDQNSAEASKKQLAGHRGRFIPGHGRTFTASDNSRRLAAFH